jgi:predicted membrane protein
MIELILSIILKIIFFQLCNALIFFILSNVLAVVLYLLLEAPFVNLEKLMFKEKDNKNKTNNLKIEKVGKNNLSFNSCSLSDSQNNENVYYVVKL